MRRRTRRPRRSRRRQRGGFVGDIHISWKEPADHIIEKFQRDVERDGWEKRSGGKGRGGPGDLQDVPGEDGGALVTPQMPNDPNMPQMPNDPNMPQMPNDPGMPQMPNDPKHAANA